MKLKPVQGRVHVRLYLPDETKGIVLPNPSMNASAEDKRTRVQCLEVADGITCCKPGDFLLLIPNIHEHMIGISKEPPTGLIHEGHILAIVTDDVAPLELD